MLIRYNKIPSIILLLMISMLVPVAGGDAAQKKKPARPKPQVNAGAVSKTRVLKDFRNAFQVPPASKMIQTYHAGKVKYYKEAVGEQKVPAQDHRVAVILQLTDCNIRIRYLWDVTYYKLETAWIFQKISQMQSKQLTWPKKKHPSLDQSEMKKILAEGMAKQYAGTEIQELTILSSKPTWRLCVPEFQVTSQATVAMKNDIYNTITKYECLFTSTIANQNGSWEHIKSGCTFKGKLVPDCFIGTMCRELSAESDLPQLSDAEAVTLLKAAFEAVYGLKKNNINVETFKLTDRKPPEDFGKKVPCTMHARFSVDEEKQTKDTNGELTISIVRAVYECEVYGYLLYSIEKKIWEGVIESCCSADKENCGLSCSYPDKGCRRLGEK